jgi:hypothetical protein
MGSPDAYAKPAASDWAKADAARPKVIAKKGARTIVIIVGSRAAIIAILRLWSQAAQRFAILAQSHSFL